WETERAAPARIGGWPIESEQRTAFALEIPYGLSFLAYGDPHAEVRGLRAFPSDLHPPVAIVHVAFQIMVGAGSWMIGVALLSAFLAWRKRGVPEQRWFLRMIAVTAPLGFIAVEAGWTA